LAQAAETSDLLRNEWVVLDLRNNFGGFVSAVFRLLSRVYDARFDDVGRFVVHDLDSQSAGLKKSRKESESVRKRAM